MSANNFSHQAIQSLIDPKEIIDHLPQMICWKDTSSVFQGCNKVFSDFLNLNSQNEIIGKTAFDIVQRNSREIENDDRIALESLSLHTITRSILYKSNQETKISGKIIPLLNEDQKPYGILCIGTIIKEFQVKSFEKLCDYIHPHSIAKILHGKKFPVETLNGRVFLSRRETACLLYLIKGMTTKQVSAAMNLSIHTVRNYIENMKVKLGCHTRIDLISQCLQAGFLKNFGIII